MPEMTLGGRNDLGRVCRALEATARLPLATGGDEAWIRSVLVKINSQHRTDIVYVRQQYGYIFSYKKLSSAVLLARIKTNHNL
jgi:hypothetical protein